MSPESMARAPAVRARLPSLIAVALAAATLGPTEARAQISSAGLPVRGFVAASLGALMPASAMNAAYDHTTSCCRSAITIEYTRPAQFAVDVTAGIVFADRITAGLSYAFSSAQVFAQGTHYFEAVYPTSSRVVYQWPSLPLTRAEAAVHISAGLVKQTGSWEWSVAGGPSYMTARYDVPLVFSVPYGRPVQTETRSTWGVHVVAGTTYYFSKAIGVGGTVRYSRATLTFPNYAERFVNDQYPTTTTVKTIAGGLEVLVGLRWRF